jgi:hypothetical protein
MEIFEIFLQSMESHPAVLSTVGVASYHQVASNQNRSTLTELDIVNSEDLLIIAVSIMLEIKVFDSTVLNPYNFTAICMLEHGQPYYPDSIRIKSLLLKLYGKLGLAKTVTTYCKNM